MRIDWTRPALEDIRGIDDWLTREASPEVAVRTLVTIRHRAFFLENFPRGGRPLTGGHRVLRVFDTPYLIRYRIVGDVVQVLRVHHEREDWQLAP
ncbi:MAG: type II toxin-antitoxin system RelE/ParE family toxin [Sphingomonas sp.]